MLFNAKIHVRTLLSTTSTAQKMQHLSSLNDSCPQMLPVGHTLAFDHLHEPPTLQPISQCDGPVLPLRLETPMLQLLNDTGQFHNFVHASCHSIYLLGTSHSHSQARTSTHPLLICSMEIRVSSQFHKDSAD